MINVHNFKNLLSCIGFIQLEGKDRGIWIKVFPSCELRVDFNREILVYPENNGFTVNERQTCNFSAPENFVVFECVNRLLSKGYSPAHIELEPKWKIGHGSSGGRADILVKDNNENALLIIECKVWGSEFENEWKSMNLSGGQLFSYAQQIKSTKFLCLYTSSFVDGVCIYDNRIVTLNDNEEYLKTLKDPLAFSDATDVQSLYQAWYITYNHEYETNGIFEDAHAAYEIGKTKYTSLDLHEINHDDIQKKYHEFATILRQHNVSGRENAFDKLVNLFLAKIVDEMQGSDELMFYWRGVAFDNYYDLQDRLQRLYRDGMQKFLNEEVTYIDNDDINKAFRLFKNDPDSTRDQIEEYFRQLKFYTNNDFAFLDVHNQHLFFQNSAILLKIVRMLQDIRLKTEEQNQFLGDLFEGFLDQGVKQSEGQFFTPTPIVKFLVSSLPLETLIEESDEPLKAIDYACGAGHFLNEYATQIRDFLPSNNMSEYYKQIVGIEKEYRLSKVAKVSAFMYGQDEIQIVYADALARNSAIKQGTYNVLISNPPYSVKGFLETLTAEERASFEISRMIDNKGILTNNSIEVFFVERAKQLLAPGGVAAIILPSSLLSNAGVYTKAREIILQHFDIVAISEFGSGTFGKTGTNTVTLFLRRKQENPALAEHYRNRVSAWFNLDFEKDGVFVDVELLRAYCNHVGYDFNDYKEFLNSVPNSMLFDSDEFMSYRAAFDNLAETKKRIKQRTFKSLSADEQRNELFKRFISYVHEIEKEKLYYFMLASSNPQSVVVVKPPTGTKEGKEFLGYEWSNRKGAEGIKYMGIDPKNDNDDETLSRLKGIKSIRTPLFNPANLTDDNKINSIIRANFNGKPIKENDFVKYYRLVDMLDFSGVKFEKQISLTSKQSVQITSQYPLQAIRKHFVYSDERINSSELTADDYVGVDNMLQNKSGKTASEFVPMEGSQTKYIPGDILLSNIRPYLKKIWLADRIGGCSNDVLVLHPTSKEILSKYLFYVISQDSFFNYVMLYKKGVKMPRGDKEKILQYEVPCPPLDIQEEIIKECEMVDEEYNRTMSSIDEYESEIEKIFSEMLNNPYVNNYNLGDSTRFDISIGKRILNTQLLSEGDVPVYSANVFEPFGYVNERLITDFSIPSVLWGIDGDWQVNYIPAGAEFYPTDHCGVLRVIADDINPRCLAWALDKAGRERGFTRALRASIDRIKRMTIQLPPVDKQNDIAEKVSELESHIVTAKSTLVELDSKKQRILKEYLQ